MTTSAMAEGSSVMMQARFKASENSASQDVTVTLDDGRINWEGGQSSKVSSIRLVDVIHSEVNHPPSKDVKSGTITSFTIHYVTHVSEKDDRRLEPNKVQFYGPGDNCEEWVKTIQAALKTTFPNRPKRLLVFINPISGRRQGRKIFEKTARPLFEKYGIETEVIVTEKSRHIEEILLSKDLTGVDGIVSVGGDGTFAEAVNGILRRSAKDNGVDENNPEADLHPVSVPIGILPTGSGDIIVSRANFTRDVVTAVLCIVLGTAVDKDVATVHSSGNLIRSSILCLADGFFTEWSRKAEGNRWMGMGRLLWGGVYALAKHPYIEVEIDYLRFNDQERDKETASGGEGANEDWKKISGKYAQLDAYVFNPAGSRIDVRKSYGDGILSLILVDECSRTNHLKFLGKFLKQDSSSYDFSFAQCIKSKAVKIRPIGAWSTNENNRYVNIDGDIFCLPSPEFSVRLHHGSIRLFSRISEDLETEG